MSKLDADLMNTRISAGTEEVMKRTRMLLRTGIVMVSFLGLAGNAAAGSPTLTAKPKLTQQLNRVPVERIPVNRVPAGHDFLPEVRVWTSAGNGSVVFPGDDMQVSFRTNQNAYVVVLNIDTRGRVSKLFPVRNFDDGFVRGGRTVQLPERGARYRLQVGGPPGVERVIAFASNEPIAHRWRSLLDEADAGFRSDARFGRTTRAQAFSVAASIRTENAELVLAAGDGPLLRQKLIPVPIDACGFTVSETWFQVSRPGRWSRY